MARGTVSGGKATLESCAKSQRNEWKVIANPGGQELTMGLGEVSPRERNQIKSYIRLYNFS